jgi:hypothetical protein
MSIDLCYKDLELKSSKVTNVPFSMRDAYSSSMGKLAS